MVKKTKTKKVYLQELKVHITSLREITKCESAPAGLHGVVAFYNIPRLAA